MKRKVELIILTVFFISTNAWALTPGVVEEHEPDSEILWNWFSYFPSELKEDEPLFILVYTDAQGSETDYNNLTTGIKTFVGQMSRHADDYGYVLLVPVIPRTNETNVIFFQKEVFSSSTPAFYKEPDLKLNMMVEDLKAEIRGYGKTVEERIFIDGFSSGGAFSHKYSLIHPEKVQAFGAGSPGGALSMPYEEYDWMLGVSNLKSLTGREFQTLSYTALPGYFYIGTEDENTTVPEAGSFWTTQDVQVLYGYGIDPVERVVNQVIDMQQNGFHNLEITTYDNVAHRWSGQMISDTFDFFDTFKTFTPRSGIWKSPDGVISIYLQKYEVGSEIIVATANGHTLVAWLDDMFRDGFSIDTDIGLQNFGALFDCTDQWHANINLEFPEETVEKYVGLKFSAVVNDNVFTPGIWRTDSGISFYLQKYEAGSAIIVTSLDGKNFVAWIDPDYTDGIQVGDDLFSHGYSISFDFHDSHTANIEAELGVSINEDASLAFKAQY